MSNRAPELHFLAKVVARVSLIFGIIILEIPFIQMAAGLVTPQPIQDIAEDIELQKFWAVSQSSAVSDSISDKNSTRRSLPPCRTRPTRPGVSPLTSLRACVPDRPINPPLNPSHTLPLVAIDIPAAVDVAPPVVVIDGDNNPHQPAAAAAELWCTVLGCAPRRCTARGAVARVVYFGYMLVVFPVIYFKATDHPLVELAGIALAVGCMFMMQSVVDAEHKHKEQEELAAATS
uniref:Uncharacterized protein n=1 Tax=Leersia perrieri TaxID=77586 RepID=A0A0D9WW23_9ORYZ